MTARLTDEQKVRVRILQYLSMLYVSVSPTLSIVSSRQIAQVLSVAIYDVEDILEFFSKQKFIALSGTPVGGQAAVGLNPPPVMEARLSPETWVTNGNKVSGFYAYYVANAPAVFRGQFAQRAQVPTKGCPLVAPPLPSACNTVMANPFNGVFEPSTIATFCCPVETVPVESCLVISNKVDANLIVTDNLILLNAYRTLLRSLFASGRGGTSFAEWLDHGPSKTSSGQLYCLAETDEALAGTLPTNPALNVAASAGGNPFGSVAIALVASDGTPMIYTPPPKGSTSGASVSVNGGAPVPAKPLGIAAHDVMIVSVLKKLS